MIRRLFKPFDTVFTVTIVSGDPKNGELIEDQLRNFFLNDQLFMVGGSCNYDDCKSIFTMYILDIEIKFRIEHIHLVIDYQNEDFDSITGDIVLFVTSTDEYAHCAYLSEVTATNRFLSNTSHISHIVLLYLGMECYNTANKELNGWLNDLTTIAYKRCFNLYEISDNSDEFLHQRIIELINGVQMHHNIDNGCRTIDTIFLSSNGDSSGIVNLVCILLAMFLNADKLNQFRFDAVRLNSQI